MAENSAAGQTNWPFAGAGCAAGFPGLTRYDRLWRMPDIRFTVPGGTAGGYLAVPPGPGPWPGVVVIHEAFGLNDDILAKANEIASHGYLALAPDLYDRRSWIRCVRAAFGQLRAGSGPAFGILD